jgi:CheY-like chemotaxis protein
MFLYDKFLGARGFDVLPARSTETARRILETERPIAVVLDVMLEGETSWQFLEWMKDRPDLRDIPALVVSVVGKEERAVRSGADEFWRKPINYDRLLGRLEIVAATGMLAKVLIVDDDDASRYVLRKHFVGTPYQLLEATSGGEAISVAQKERPSVILLDFHLGDATALEVIDALRADVRTRDIPRVIVSGLRFDEQARQKLERNVNRILSKTGLSKELALRSIREALVSAGIGPALPHRPRHASGPTGGASA